jgi:peptide/nickel transport system permease protein
VGAFGGLIIIMLLLMALLADVIAPFRYDEFNIPERLQSPSWNHLFGTDNQGRDVFSRVVYGARTSVYTGFGALALTTLVATAIGIYSAYYGGIVDLFFQRLVDIWQAFPGLIFIIFVVAIAGPGTTTLIISIGLLFASRTSRLVRSQALAVKAQPYTESARVVGAPNSRIIFFHILPNVVPIILISASVQIGAVILLESSLAFLGYGTPPPFPSWGRMLQEAQRDTISNPHLAIFPGLAIALVVYAFNMFGDALRDTFDPRMRGSK